MPFWDTVRNPESLFDAVWFLYFVPFWFYRCFLRAFWFYHFLPFSNEILCKSVKKLTVDNALFDLRLKWTEQFQLAFVIFDLSTVSWLGWEYWPARVRSRAGTRQLIFCINSPVFQRIAQWDHILFELTFQLLQSLKFMNLTIIFQGITYLILI